MHLEPHVGIEAGATDWQAGFWWIRKGAGAHGPQCHYLGADLGCRGQLFAVAVVEWNLSMLVRFAVEDLHVMHNAGRLDDWLELHDMHAILDKVIQTLHMAPVSGLLTGHRRLLQRDFDLLQVAEE